MARKNNSREEGAIHFDTRTRTVMAESRQENLKEKIKAVREVVPGKNRDELVMVLQYFEYNVEKTIQAYLEDGAKTVLQEWSHTQTNRKGKSKKDRPEYIPKSKLKEAALKAAAMNGTNEAAPNHINENGTGDVGGVNLPNGHAPEEHSKSPELTDNETPRQPSSTPSPMVTTTTTAKVMGPPQAPQQQRNQHRGDRGKGKGPRESHSVHHNMVKLHHQRERTMSERSNASSAHGGDHGHHSLDKSFKDLQRQTTSLERLKHLLDSEIDRSSKSVKKVFDEIRKGLDERESKVLEELDVVKTEANEMLESRHSKAKDLKRMVERAERLSENEISDLRSQIKHFVTDRRHDEELGRTTRFMYDSDHLLNEVKKFGEVIHIPKAVARRPSAASTNNNGHDHVSQDYSGPNGVARIEERLKNDLHIKDTCVKNQQRTAPTNGPRNKDKQSRGPKSPKPRQPSTTTTASPLPPPSASSSSPSSPPPSSSSLSSTQQSSPQPQRPQQQRQRRPDSNRSNNRGESGGASSDNKSPTTNSNNNNISNSNNNRSSNRGGGSNRGQGRDRGSNRGRGSRSGYRGNQPSLNSHNSNSGNTTQQPVPA